MTDALEYSTSMALTARSSYRFGPYRLDGRDRLLYKNGEFVALPPKVLDTLVLLVSSGGRVLTKDEMIKQLWPDTFVEEGTLTQYISVLRKTLGEGGNWIENLPRRGYRFTTPVEELSEEVAQLRIEEHTSQRTVTEEEIVTGQGLSSRLRWLAAGLGILILLAGAAAIIGRRPAPTKSISSIAVLPFRTVSDARENYLADGITEALITRLTNLKGLRVISYSMVRRFKNTPDDAAKIGRQLGVEAVIEGTVRVASGRLRISLQGVDTKNGYTIWAIDRFEANPEGLLDIEGQIAQAAAQQVRGQLTAGEKLLVTKSRATNPDAYDLVLRARSADTKTTIQLLNQAVQLDPGFGDAYGWLALAQLRAYWGSRAGAETLRNAISNANHALSRDPNSSIAIRALVHIQHATGREVEGLLMARRALENNPDDLDVIAAAAEAYFRTGLYDRAIPLYEKALSGEPGNVEFRTQLARMYLFLGQHAKGLEAISALPPDRDCCFGPLLYAETGQMAKAVEIARGNRGRPHHGFPAYIRGHVLDTAGDHAGAREIWTGGLRYGEELLDQNENPSARVMDGMIYARLGQKENALRNLRQSLAHDPQHPVILLFAAQIRGLLGLRRETLETLKAAVEKGFFNLPLIEFHTRPGLAFHSVKDDPEFHAIRTEVARRIAELRTR